MTDRIARDLFDKYKTAASSQGKSDLLDNASAWAVACGIAYLPDPLFLAQTAPIRFSLMPHPFSLRLFNFVVGLTPAFHKLVHNMSSDPRWVIDSLKEVCKSDPFTEKLCRICREVYVDDIPIWFDKVDSLYLLRNDFLPSHDGASILQVEINTISVSFANISEQLSVYHDYVLRQVHFGQGTHPQSTSGTSYADAIAGAVKSYSEMYNAKPCSTIVVMIVEPNEKNQVDQRLLEFALMQRHNVYCCRLTLQQAQANLKFDEITCSLHLDSLEVALVYFRSGYSPSHYPSDIQWKARRKIERSRCIKVPSICTQLVGSKKIQQLFSDSEEGVQILAKYGLNNDEIRNMSNVFCTQVDPSLGGPYVEDAMNNPSNWVLKPQREGGGNNLYDEEIRTKLGSASEKELQQYVLMRRIRPPQLPAIVSGPVRNGKLTSIELPSCVSELGIYSVYMPGHRIDTVCGHMLRTKDSTVNEGGVNAGFSFLDSALLIDY